MEEEQKTSFAQFVATDASFSTGDGQTISRIAKYFECGNEFTDLQGIKFGVSEAEADAGIARFVPKPLNIEHIPTPFDGLLGEVKRLWRQGKDVMAQIDIPKALNDLTAGQPMAISSEWDIKTKTPLGAALCLKPAVRDAVMQAAFAQFSKRHDTPEGQGQLQYLHDQAARSGAVCSPENARMAARHEATALQQIHDIAVTHGAKCASGGARTSMFTEPQTQSELTIPKESKMPTTFEEFMAKFKTFFAGEQAEESPAAAGASDAEKERIKALEAQVAKLSADAGGETAKTTVEEIIRSGRAVPAERPFMLAAFAQAAADDAAKPTIVKFSVGEDAAKRDFSLSRVDALRAMYASRPAHALTTEQLRSVLGSEEELVALMARSSLPNPADKNKVADDKELARLKGMTSLGKETVAAAK